MAGSSGKNVKKSRRSKNEAALEVVKKTKPQVRKPDWVKLRKYRANRLAGMNQFQSAVNAGWSHSMARKHASRFDRLSKGGIIKALEDAGATDTIMAREVVNIAMNATKRIPCTVEVRTEEDGEVVIDDKAKEEVPDLHLRKDTWEFIAKLKKQIGPNVMSDSPDYDGLVIVVKETNNNFIAQNQKVIVNAQEGNTADGPTELSIQLADQPR